MSRTSGTSRSFLSASTSASRRRRGLFSARRTFAVAGVGLLSLVTLLAFSSNDAFAATAVNLGSATPYAVLAGTTVTNTGPTVITGDVGLSPGTAITGFPPGIASGTIIAADAGSLAAQNSSTTAFGVASGETSTSTVAGGILGGGAPLVPGVYTSGSSLQVNGTLTLNGGGDANAVFIFQAGSTLTTASSSSIVLTGGAQACNVFWTVGSSATLGTTTNFVGNILALTSITMNSGATIQGSVLAQNGAVTLDDNTISIATCAVTGGGSTPPTTTTTTTTTTTPVATTPTTPTGPTTPPVTVKKPVITVTKPVGTTPTKSTKPAAPSPSASGVTIIPVGAPETGDGGTAGSSFSPLGLIALGGMAATAAAGSIAIGTRRRRNK
jgi:hypothetical protein